jgi:hypothetical protein
MLQLSGAVSRPFQVVTPVTTPCSLVAKETNKVLADSANQAIKEFVIATSLAYSSTVKMEEVRCCETPFFLSLPKFCVFVFSSPPF